MSTQTRVLVADDSYVMRESLRMRLAGWGIRVQLAVDGEDAWRHLQSPDAPHIAILDWTMPGADGLEVCRRLRSLERDYYTYVILLTAHEKEEEIAAGFAAGVDDYLFKDSPAHELRTRLDVARRIAAVQDELLHAREQLRRQARHDSLTGLLNRGAGEEELERELHRAARVGPPFGVLMLDLDHFKAINDGRGHEAGDRVLRAVAQTLEGFTRAQDLVIRWGGEEFLAILPGVDLEGAVAAAERIRVGVSETPVHLAGGSLHVTASLGVAAVPSGGRAKEELLAAVDAALYRAKATTRNCVVSESASSARDAQPRPMLATLLGECEPTPSGSSSRLGPSRLKAAS